MGPTWAAGDRCALSNHPSANTKLHWRLDVRGLKAGRNRVRASYEVTISYGPVSASGIHGRYVRFSFEVPNGEQSATGPASARPQRAPFPPSNLVPHLPQSGRSLKPLKGRSREVASSSR